ncbi:MAG: hypothetical protein WAO95_06050 [Burkholderiales bacterium]
MSGGGESAPAPAAKPAAAPPVDPVEELARQVFVQLSANVHAAPGERPDHEKLVELSFRLAEAFLAGNMKFNTAARQRAEAKAKASVDVSKIEFDFGAVSASAKK